MQSLLTKLGTITYNRRLANISKGRLEFSSFVCRTVGVGRQSAAGRCVMECPRIRCECCLLLPNNCCYNVVRLVMVALSRNHGLRYDLK